MCFSWFKRQPKPPDPSPNPPPSIPVPYEHEVPSPRDIIDGGSIIKNERRNCIEIHLPFPVSTVSVHPVADTNSMDGLMDWKHNICMTNDPTEILASQVGDVITFLRKKGTPQEYLVCHQIVAVNQDGLGIFFTTQGIRNLEPDPEKHRIEDIKGTGFNLTW